MSVITIETFVQKSPELVWEFWTLPKHITQWNQASPDWHTPHATSDLKPGGRFLSRMEAKDGSFGFDLSGTFDNVIFAHTITYTLDDARKVEVRFIPEANGTKVIESFEAEKINSEDLQRMGWQAILDSFKSYAEAQ